MREIKFRAWDKKEKIMKNRIVVGCDFEFDRYKTYVYELKPFKSSINLYQNENLIPMQYTGLKDKNGKEIYEGDILLFKNVERPSGVSPYFHDVMYEVVFKYSQWFAETIENFEGATLFYSERLNKWFSNVIEIVGNVYESPELLKDK